jgi:hypothetical protein
MEQLHPHLREELAPSLGQTVTIDAAVEGLEWTTIVKLSQALSMEIVLDKCVHVLMRVIAEAILDSTGVTVRAGPPGGSWTLFPDP